MDVSRAGVSLGRLRSLVKIRRDLNASIMIARDWKLVFGSVFFWGGRGC